MFPYIVFIVCVVIFLIVYAMTFLVISDFYLKKRMLQKIEKFESHVAVLEFHMQKAYDIIYKDRILIYSLEATRPNDNEFDVISKDFSYLVLKMIGPNLQNEFTELYGNEETFIFNMVEYFNTKFEGDQIREKAKDNLFNEQEKKLF